jgi:hypothetical protein
MKVTCCRYLLAFILTNILLLHPLYGQVEDDKLIYLSKMYILMNNTYRLPTTELETYNQLSNMKVDILQSSGLKKVYFLKIRSYNYDLLRISLINKYLGDSIGLTLILHNTYDSLSKATYSNLLDSYFKSIKDSFEPQATSWFELNELKRFETNDAPQHMCTYVVSIVEKVDHFEIYKLKGFKEYDILSFYRKVLRSNDNITSPKFRSRLLNRNYYKKVRVDQLDLQHLVKRRLGIDRKRYMPCTCKFGAFKLVHYKDQKGLIQVKRIYFKD